MKLGHGDGGLRRGRGGAAWWRMGSASVGVGHGGEMAALAWGGAVPAREELEHDGCAAVEASLAALGLEAAARRCRRG